MEFNIGQTIYVRNTNEIPESQRRTFAKVAGKRGVIVDKMRSEASATTVYRVRIDGSSCDSSINYPSYVLMSSEKTKQYTVDVQVEDGVAVAVLYETNGDKKTELYRGHGHILHDGVEGVAQAVSYACKRLYLKVTDASSYFV